MALLQLRDSAGEGGPAKRPRQIFDANRRTLSEQVGMSVKIDGLIVFSLNFYWDHVCSVVIDAHCLELMSFCFSQQVTFYCVAENWYDLA